jgi:hypothetical protein
MKSFCANVPVIPQRSPSRNPGGDCFAAALNAAMSFMFGESAPSYDECWEAFQSEQTSGNGEKWIHLGNTWPGMRDALYKLSGSGWKLEIFADTVAPRAEDPERFSYCWGAKVDGYEWARRLDAWLRAGYLALGEVMLNGCETGEWCVGSNGRPQRNTNDHFVLYDGVRCGWRSHEVVPGASSLVYQVHVVCSSRGGRAYWIDVDEHLRNHGAGGWWLVARDTRGPLDEGAS